MSRRSFIVAVVVGGAALAQPLPAVAGAVTDADLRGKKICWNTGFISTYNKDGSFDGNRAGARHLELERRLGHGERRARVGSKQYQQRRGHFSQHSEGLEERQGHRGVGQVLQLSN